MRIARNKDIITLFAALIFIIAIFIVTSLVLGNNICYKQKLGFSLPAHSVVIKKIDTHKGFLDDGEALTEIKIDNHEIRKFIKKAKKTGNWNPIPLRGEMNALIYGGKYKGKCYNNICKLTIYIPRNIKTGIYRVQNRQVTKSLPYRDPSILQQNSFNFTISVLDIDTGKLYIYTLDT